jgi:glycosyltransferase involved in cell wall biosynthesis
MAQGHTCRIAYGREPVPEKYQDISYRIGSDLEVKANAMQARALDNEGFCAKSATKKFLKWADNYNPDVLWLHNIHGYYLNIELLFDWIKQRPHMQVKWTLHDCWAFTGHCSYFSYVGCHRWQEECHNCVQKKEYPQSLLADRSAENFRRKQKAFCGVPNMTIITPSQWLADLVKQSFLKEYPVEVRHNTIDRSVFKPTASNFRERMGLMDKKIVLGVASVWDRRKGLADFVRLSGLLPEQYQVVLVGVDESQGKILPANIVQIRRTNSARELAEIYTAADVFVNPSREETFGMTTIEAMACGTPAIVYENTACEEVVRTYGGIATE